MEEGDTLALIPARRLERYGNERLVVIGGHGLTAELKARASWRSASRR